jgi:hypothetical protein
MTHDYKRHGTTTLFAALGVLEGRIIGPRIQRHRYQEFIRSLNAVEAEAPAGKVIHVILDNYAVHKHPKVRAWLERHPHWTFHLTPTSTSWLNAVEGPFAKLTNRRPPGRHQPLPRPGHRCARALRLDRRGSAPTSSLVFAILGRQALKCSPSPA